MDDTTVSASFRTRMHPVEDGRSRPKIHQVSNEPPRRMLWDIWHPDKSTSMDGKLLYQTLHPKNKEVGVTIAMQTLRLMGSGARAYDPDTYMQPIGRKVDRRQVNRATYLNSAMSGTRQIRAKAWWRKRTKARKKFKAQRWKEIDAKQLAMVVGPTDLAMTVELNEETTESVPDESPGPKHNGDGAGK